MKFTVNPSELPQELAYRAHYGTSFVPEDRATMEQREFAHELMDIYNRLKARIQPDQAEQLNAEMNRFKASYLARKTELLASRSRIVSPMIAGPARFPVHTMEKRNNSYQKKLNEFCEWKERAIKAIERNLGLTKSHIISSDDADAIEKLQAKIAEAEQLQEAMKAANKIIKRKITDAEKVAAIVQELGFKEETAWKLLKPDFMGRVGFPSYALQNNNANIRRMKERIEQITKQRAQATTETTTTTTGAKIIDNVEENRVQVFFDAKPGEDIRAKLKSHGFRWAPSVGAWQRHRSVAALQVAKEICSQLGA